MVAETLASSGDVFTRDDDLELVGAAIPFGLKLYESLLDSAPTNKDLLIATCSNFTQYGVAYLETDALVLGDAQHHDEVVRLNARALKLYLRAKGYCERAMEVRFPGIMQKLPADPVGALAKAEKKDVPLLYWMAASWGSAIALGVDRPDLVIDMPTVRALADRALALDETWSRGTLHEMFVSLDSLPPALGGNPERARMHFTKAVELQKGLSAGSVRRAGARRLGAGTGSRRVREAAERGAGGRPGEGSFEPARHARAAAARARAARSDRHSNSQVTRLRRVR